MLVNLHIFLSSCKVLFNNQLINSFVGLEFACVLIETFAKRLFPRFQLKTYTKILREYSENQIFKCDNFNLSLIFTLLRTDDSRKKN